MRSIKAAKRVVTAAGGRKAPAIAAALKGGHVGVFIADHRMAERLARNASNR